MEYRQNHSTRLHYLQALSALQTMHHRSFAGSHVFRVLKKGQQTGCCHEVFPVCRSQHVYKHARERRQFLYAFAAPTQSCYYKTAIPFLEKCYIVMCLYHRSVKLWYSSFSRLFLADDFCLSSDVVVFFSHVRHFGDGQSDIKGVRITHIASKQPLEVFL